MMTTHPLPGGLDAAGRACRIIRTQHVLHLAGLQYHLHPKLLSWWHEIVTEHVIPCIQHKHNQMSMPDRDVATTQPSVCRASSFSSGTMSPATAKELRSAAAGRLSHSSTSGNGRSSGPSKLLPPSPSTPSKAASSSPGSDRRGASTHARSSTDSPLGPQGSGSRGDPARRNVTRQASDNEHSPGAQRAGRPLASTRSGEQLPGSAEARRSGGSESGLSPGGLPRRPAGASATDGGIRKQNSVSHDGAEKSPPGRIKALSGASDA